MSSLAGPDRKRHALDLLKHNQPRIAKPLLEAICRDNVHDAEAWCALGAVHGMLGEGPLAVSCCRQAVDLRPDYAEAYRNLGAALELTGCLDEAIATYREALRLAPDDGTAYFNLGNALRAAGRLHEAIAAYEEALRHSPKDADILVNLGGALVSDGRFAEAAMRFREALRIRPDNAEAYNNLGFVLDALGQQDEAIDAYRRAVTINPRYAHAHGNLGNTCLQLGRLDEAISCQREAVRLEPGLADAHLGLGNALLARGDLGEALRCFERARTIKADYAPAWGNLLFALNYQPEWDAASLFAEHVAYGKCRPAPDPIPPGVTPEPGRRLRVGYVSPDLRRHSVAYFIEAVLAHHDASETESFCYADVIHPDETTARLRTQAHNWRDTCLRSDSAVAELMRADRIDILVDLAGHTAKNRLGVFALKPAPVQVTYLGYPNTTGLTEIDYYITDAWADPPGTTEQFYTEELIRLPQGFSCYRPIPEAPEVGPLPARLAGHITFASFNNLAKINHAVMALWARVLHALPGSKLLLQDKAFADESVSTAWRGRFEQEGIAPDRLELLKRTGLREHLALHQRVDIGLDPFPWNGHTTTCHALWMGVPVITHSGQVHAGRLATSVLHQIDLPELVARNPEEYVEIAVTLAKDLERLASVRAGLRERMRGSSLCDGPGFTRHLEAAYREMWRRWCEQQRTG